MKRFLHENTQKKKRRELKMEDLGTPRFKGKLEKPTKET